MQFMKMEPIRIIKFLKDKRTNEDFIAVNSIHWRSLSVELKSAFAEILNKDPQVTMLKFGVIKYLGGLDSVWVDKLNTRSWERKLGGPFYSIDTNE